MFKKIKAKLGLITKVVSVACMSLLIGLPAFAAVDADVASTTGVVVSTMKENIIGVITTNIADIVIVGVIIFSITFVYRLAKKFMGGR